MTITKMLDQFPDENACKLELRRSREYLGIVCKKCHFDDQKWLPKKEQWECRTCGFRTTLKSGTIFENSKMPLRIWFLTMGLMTLTKKGFSCKEIQRQVGHKRYEPIWQMMHKIRMKMGKSMSRLEYLCKEKCHGMIEFLDIEPVKTPISNSKSIGAFIPRKSVAKGEKIPFLRLKATDTTAEHKKLNGKQWPTRHLQNFNRVVDGIYHRVQDKYLQNYLDEFCFKANKFGYSEYSYKELWYVSIQPFW